MSRAVVGNQRATDRSGSAKNAKPARVVAKPSDGYFAISSLPLTSLLFLLPLIVVYEVGTRWYASDPVSHVEQRILAFRDLQNFFDWFGATGPWMPAAAVVSILLACHIARNDIWQARSGVLMGMSLESLMYAIPLVTMGYIFQHYLLLRPTSHNWRMMFILSIGAGIYEELVFRLILFHLLHVILLDLLKVPKARAVPLMVVLSAVSFSLYHYQIPWLFCNGSEQFDWQSFVFRALAGIYFGVIFMWRGFGLTAGAHASYDIVIVVLRMATQG
jgi:membrane protease YdiL (CAAX protease family)